MAIAAGRPAAPAVREALPGWARQRVGVEVDGGRLTVRLRPPSPLGTLERRLEVSSSAWVRRPGGERDERARVLATDLGEASGGLAVAAAVGVAVAVEQDPGKASGVLLAELGAERGRGPTMLASAPARELEERLREAGLERVAARGRLCWLGLPATEEALEDLPRALAAAPAASLAIVHLPARLWPLALEQRGLRPRAGLLRADLPTDRALAALAVAELRERRLPVRVAARPLGRVASRRAMAGLEAGGAVAKRVGRLARGLAGRAGAPAAERGQALLLMLGAAFAILFAAALLAALGGALTGTARVQRAADLVAISGARSLRDDFPRLFTAPRLASGAPNPRHLERREYLARAAIAARQAAARNGVDPDRLRVSFPDADSFAPLRVHAEVTASVDPEALPGQRGEAAGDRSSTRSAIRVEASAEAEASPPSPPTAGGMPTTASGGGYSGPLAYRQGKPMRPDVASAFDRMAAAARRAGISLVISSAYRSDAEQARLFAQHPDPRWVAPPGQSLHRCGTELDLGPTVRLLVAGRPRAALRLPEALLLGGLALRLYARHRRPAPRWAPPPSAASPPTVPRRVAAAFPASSRSASGCRSCAPRRGGTSPRACSPRS